MPYLESDELKLHWQQTGAGPDVVLIHAFTSNLAIWMLTGVVEQLSARYRVTSYDLRGHGASSVPATGYTSANMVEDFQSLHTHLGLGPAYLVGHSFGGVIGLHAALECPERVQGVVLSDTYFPGLRHLEPDMGQTEVWQDLRETLQEVGAEIGASVDFQRLFVVVRELKSEQLATIQEKMGPAGTRWLSQIGQLAATTAGRETFEVAGLTAERLKTVQQPVLALYDELSPFPTTCRWLEAELPHCTSAIVPDAKHLAPVQNPQAFCELVLGALDRWQQQVPVAGRG